MAGGTAYAVFVIPVIFTIVFGSAVLAGALEEFDRELNMWPGPPAHAPPVGSVDIVGLQDQYAAAGAVLFQVSVTDDSLDCGTLYIRVYDSAGDVFAEGSFEEQCFAAGSVLLPPDGFSVEGAAPGSYTVTATMSAHGNQLIGSGVFQVVDEVADNDR